MSLRAKIKANFGASLISQVFGALYQILAVPMFLHSWGNGRYGAWLVLTAIPSWLSLTNLGFGNAAGTELALRMSRGDVRGANRSLQSGWVGILAISLIGLIVVGPSVAFFPWERWLHIAGVTHREGALALMLLAINTFLGFQSPLFGAILWGEGKAAVYLACNAVLPLLNLAVSFVALRLNGGFVAVALALLAVQVVFIPALAILALRSSKRLKLGFSEISAVDVKFCLRKGIAFCMLPLGNAMLLQGSLLVVNDTLGVIGVVTFGTARTLTRSAWQLMNMINQTAIPELNRLLGSGDWDRAKRLHRASVLMSIVCGWTAAVLLVAIGPYIYKYWTAKQLIINRPTLALFSVGVITNSLWFTSSTVLLATNKHEGIAWRFLMGSALNLPLCYLLSSKLGIYGAAASPILVDLIMIPYVLSMSLRVTHDTYGDFVRSWREPWRRIMTLISVIRGPAASRTR